MNYGSPASPRGSDSGPADRPFPGSLDGARGSRPKISEADSDFDREGRDRFDAVLRGSARRDDAAADGPAAEPADDFRKRIEDKYNHLNSLDDGDASSGDLSYLLQNYPHVVRNPRITDFLVDPDSGITPALILKSIRERERRAGRPTPDRRRTDPAADAGRARTMATTAKHARDKFDAGEEDIAAFAKQISDHAEAIYQTWKSRGLGPAEILNCRTPQNAADEFGPALTPQGSSPKTPVADLLARAPDMDNNNLEKLVNSFVNEDKARIAAQRNGSPSKATPSSIRFALQKFEKGPSPGKPSSPSSTGPFGQKIAPRGSPGKPAQSPPASSPKPAIGVKPQIAPKAFAPNHADVLDGETVEVTYPPDLVPQKPETPKRPVGLSLQIPANLQTWPLKNKIIENKTQKSQNDGPRADYAKTSPKREKYSTTPGAANRANNSAYLDEVAREEERLINALKTGAVLSGEDLDVALKSIVAKSPTKRERSPVGDVPVASVRPDLIPIEKADERDCAPSVSLVDYAKTKYKDSLENPMTQQRLDANRQLDAERKAALVPPSLGLQVTETRSKFESGRWGAPRGLGPRRTEQVPHPELTTQQKQHIRAQADKVAGSPVRPFLTRGSVAERVLIFEKCPSELLLDKRKSPAVSSWRTGHDVIAKAQTYGAGRCASAPSCGTTSTPGTLQRAARAHSAGLGPSARRAPVPRFHFPNGRPQPQSALDQAVLRIQSAFATFPNSQVSRESFHHIVKACECPLYWKAPLFLATQRNLHSPVDGHKFIDFWRQMTTQCHDQPSRFVYILTRGASTTLGPEDLSPLVQDVVDTHPGLSFLKEATEFHSRYVHTVIARIFYCVNRSWSGRITIPELRRSDLLQVLQLLEEEEDINQVTAYFSYEHFYVIYCKFWELDRDHDLFIDKHDLARHNDHALSSRMIERVVSGCVTRVNRGRKRNVRPETENDESRMSYTEFVWFLLAEEDKQHPTAIEYWFRCMDLDGDGYLSMYELEYFYEEQMHRMEAIGIETLPFQDCLCQMLDMVQPKQRDKICLGDLKTCKMTPIFFDTFFNLEKYLDHEQRDPFASQRDHDADGHELSEWDRFAAEEYELLVAEEGGSDAQDQASYDETDDDCLSPNLDEILSTEIVEDSCIADSNVQSGKFTSSHADKQDLARKYDKSNGCINLTSIYTTPVLEKAILLNSGEQYSRNGYLDRLKQTTNDSTSKIESNQGGNNSFLYRHLLSPLNRLYTPPKDYECENFQEPLVYTNIQNESLPVANIAYNNTLGGSTLNKLSFTSGINKISDNYEKAISNIPQKDISTLNRLAIFKKDVNPNVKLNTKKSQQYKEEDDDADYARESDECSI